MKKIILMLGLGVMLIFGNEVLAGFEMGVQPLKTELEMEAGEEKLVKMKIVNRGDEGFLVKGEVEVFTKNDEGGFPESGGEGMDDWIDLEGMEIWVPENGEAEVNFLVRVPENAGPGGKYFAVVWEPVLEEGGGIQVRTRMACLILVRVAGEVVEAGRVTDFGLKTEEMVSDEPVEFEVRFVNEGNVHVKPEGKIWIFDEKGEAVLGVGRLDGKLVDFIPVNPGGGNVLPGSERIFVPKWHDLKAGKNWKVKLEMGFGEEGKIFEEVKVEIEVGTRVRRFDFDGEKFSFVLDNQNGKVIVRPEFWVEIWDEDDVRVGQIEISDDEYLLPGNEKEFVMRLAENLKDGKHEARLRFASGMLGGLDEELEFWVGMDGRIWQGILGGFGVVLGGGGLWWVWHRKKRKFFKNKK